MFRTGLFHVADLDIPFKGHHPVKTSSPAEQRLAAEEEKQDDEKSQVVSPILFMCEDERIEEVKKDSLPTQNPQCNGQFTEEYGNSYLVPSRKCCLYNFSCFYFLFSTNFSLILFSRNWESGLESPPSKVVLTKISGHKKEIELQG